MKVTEEQRNEAMVAYKSGETLRSVAARYGVSFQAVHQWAIVRGVRMREPYDSEKKRENDQKIPLIMKELCKTGSVAEACRKIGAERTLLYRRGLKPLETRCYWKAHNRCRNCGAEIGDYRFGGTQRRCRPCGLKRVLANTKDYL